MARRLKSLGIVLAVFGLIALTIAGVAYVKVQAGQTSFQALSNAENVTLSYNEAGELVDHGTTESAQAIMSILTDEWKYPVVQSDLDPNDPVINTPTEYMYQMATITHHVIDGTQTVVLDQDVEYNGVTYPAGTPIDVAVDHRYWSDFDRSNPIDAAVRGQAWSATAHALIAEVGVGAVTANVLTMGVGVAAAFGVLGVLGLLTGLGLIWVSRAEGLQVPETVATLTKEQDLANVNA